MIKKTLIICIKVLSLILIVLLMAYLFKTCRDFGYKVFSDRAKDAAGSPQVVEAVIHVDQGESLLEIGEELEFLSIIRDKYVFAVSARCMDDYDKIQEGDYVVNSAQKPSEILTSMLTKEDKEK